MQSKYSVKYSLFRFYLDTLDTIESYKESIRIVYI